ncbi:pheromone processing endoprotease [Batrachochytrium dendrobatidis]
MHSRLMFLHVLVGLLVIAINVSLTYAVVDTAPHAPPNDHQSFHYVAVQLDTTEWPDDADQRELLAKAIAHDMQLLYTHQVGQLRDHFIYAMPKSRQVDQEVVMADDSVVEKNTHIHHNHISQKCKDHSSVLWHELQEPQQRLFKRGYLQPSSPLPLFLTSPVFPQLPSTDVTKYQTTKMRRAVKDPSVRIGDVRKLVGIEDPRFQDQWHLFNPDEPGHDMNITGVWIEGISGKGITIGFIDDGLDYENPDLKDNYAPEGSYDFNFHKLDPMPTLMDDNHGTRCAGEVAAVKNNVCGIGVAWSSKVSGLRVLSGRLTNTDEAAAINYAFNTTQIYSCSWGPRDDGKTMEAPPQIVTRAVKNGIDNGRNGLGSLFVFAAGNGGARGDNCNFDGYTNSIYTITVAAIDRYEGHPSFSEQCPANMISMWSGQGGFSGIITTDWKTGCTDRHGGTSAAAPLAAGIYSLVLSIRPDLTWRDVQRLTLETAIPVNLQDSDWLNTAAGRLYNHKYGYGTIDAYTIVEAAKHFVNLNPQVNLSTPYQQVNMVIPPYNPMGARNTINITALMVQEARLLRLEHITVTVDIKHSRRGDITIHLESPMNIRSRLIEGRAFDDNADGFKNWTMMTVMHWDEAIVGQWRLVVIDDKNVLSGGYWNGWQISFWGEGIDRQGSEAAIPPTSPPPGIPPISPPPGQPFPTTHEVGQDSSTETSPIIPQNDQDPTMDIIWYLFLLTLAVVGACSVYILWRKGIIRMPGYAAVKTTEAIDDIPLDEVVWNTYEEGGLGETGRLAARSTRSKNSAK